MTGSRAVGTSAGGRAVGCALSLALLIGLATIARAHDAGGLPEGETAAPELSRLPELDHFEPAEYPPGALAAGREGSVVLQVDIAADGSVLDAQVVEPAGYGFDDAARRAVMRFHFRPAEVDGEAVAVRVTYTYTFSIVPDQSVPDSDAPAPVAEPAPVSGEHERAAADPDSEHRTTVRQTGGPDRTASARHIGPRELSVQNHRTAEDFLRLAAGVVLVQHGSEGKGIQIFLRGFDAVHGQDVEVLVAGVPINEPSNVHGQGYLDLGFIIPETVRGLDVAKGPFRLDQGNFATAGTFSFELGVPEARRGTTLALTGGTTYRQRGLLLVAPRGAAESTFVAAEAVRDDGFGSGRHMRRAGATAGVRAFDDAHAGSLDLLVAGAIAEFGLPAAVRREDVASGRIGFYDSYRDDTGGASDRVLISARHRIRRGRASLDTLIFGGYRRLELLDDFTGYLAFPIEGDRKRQAQTAWTGGARLRARIGLTERLALEVGLDGQIDRVDQRETRVDADHRSFQEVRDAEFVQTGLAAFAGLLWRPSPRWRVQTGARVDAFHFGVHDRLLDAARHRATLGAVSPRLSVGWRPAGAWELFCAYGRGLRSPEARATVRVGSGADEDHSGFTGGRSAVTTSDSVEAGLRYTPTTTVELGLAAFGTFIAHESVFDHVSGLNLELTATRRLGAEAWAHVTPVEWLDLRADLTLTDARFTGSGHAVPGSPRWTASLAAAVHHASGLRAGARLVAIGSRPLAYGATAGGYALLDVQIGYRTGPLDLALQIDNLTGRRYAEGEFNFASDWDAGPPRSQIPSIHDFAGAPRTARLTLAITL
ncbi:MAG: TonB-dependent receptor [Deltaproteobacteria bacterium]|nr:TonB-dependent receptor [Deltaproteobacteria bacterium]MCB9785583.1 TonB-dependent receptor [Deltaproteobacteria bacterium]